MYVLRIYKEKKTKTKTNKTKQKLLFHNKYLQQEKF